MMMRIDDTTARIDCLLGGLRQPVFAYYDYRHELLSLDLGGFGARSIAQGRGGRHTAFG
jgi:hypothetical protein